MKRDPYTPAEKVEDTEVAKLLRELIGKLDGKPVVHTAAPAPAPSAPVRVEKFDDSRMVALLTDVSRQLARLDLSPKATVKLDDGGITRELRTIADKISKAAPRHGLDPHVSKALTAIANRPQTTGGGFGPKVFALRDDERSNLLSAASPGYVSSPLSAKVGDSKFFLMSSSLAVAAGAEATWSITNPTLLSDGVTSNTKVIYIVHVGASTDDTAQIRFDVYKDSTITGGTTRTPWSPNFAAASESVTEVVDGSGIRSGGTQLEAKIAVTVYDPYEFEGLVILAPGQSLQLTGVVPGTLSDQQLTVGARWYEEA